MFSAIKFCESNSNPPNLSRNRNHIHRTINSHPSFIPPRKLHSPSSLNLPFSSLSMPSPATASTAQDSRSTLVSTIGSPPSSYVLQLNLNRRHIHALNALACAAFKRAAESLEQLLDVTREELPDTMAAIRLSGMEISDLTMELSDLGQEITQGVRNSTRAVCLAEDRLRQLTNMTPTALVQEQAILKTETVGHPAGIARTARNLREGIVKGRVVFQVLFGTTRFYKWAMNFMASHKK